MVALLCLAQRLGDLPDVILKFDYLPRARQLILDDACNAAARLAISWSRATFDGEDAVENISGFVDVRSREQSGAGAAAAKFVTSSPWEDT